MIFMLSMLSLNTDPTPTVGLATDRTGDCFTTIAAKNAILIDLQFGASRQEQQEQQEQ